MKLCIRALTKSLLKADWQLKLDIPPASLCPTVPNRLNYLLELNDLVHFCCPPVHPKKIHILDIGTGCSCIFPLLGCRLFPHWHVSATDIDPDALVIAQKNVTRNQLGNQISLYQTSATDPFFPFTQNMDLVATLCNPPFYESVTARTAHRNEKVTGHMVLPATDNQVSTSGGEVAFVTKMIADSVTAYMGTQRGPAVFTSMLGIKKSVDELITGVIREFNVPWYTVKTVRLGITTRWVLAWSLNPGVMDRHYKLYRVVAAVEGMDVFHSVINNVLAGLPIVCIGDRVVDLELSVPSWTRKYKRGWRSEEQQVEPPISVRVWWDREVEVHTTSSRRSVCVWIAGPLRSELMHSFGTYLVPALERNLKKYIADGGTKPGRSRLEPVMDRDSNFKKRRLDCVKSMEPKN